MRRSSYFALALTAAMLVAHARDTGAAVSPQVPVAGTAIPQFKQPLPVLSVAAPGNPNTINTVFGNQPLTLTMCEFKSRVLPPGTFAPGAQPETWTWGYVAGTTCPTTPQETYLGPVIVSARAAPGASSPTEIRFVNNLGSAATTNVLAYKYSTDQTLHWADPAGMGMNQCNMDAMKLDAMGGMSYPSPGTTCAQNYAGSIPAVPHLHGGEVPPELDGGPDAWFTSDGVSHGAGYYTKSGSGNTNEATYAYPNTQEAGPAWFHDHTLGATRLNVYAGLAGGYVITDPGMSLPTGLQGTEGQIVPVILQDRSFDTNGQLYFQAGPAWALNPQHPYWSPEFVGDVMVVNGKAWPYLNVEPRRYRFLFINGSNARTYELYLTNPVTKVNGPPLWVIGNDGGYLDAAYKIDPNAAKPNPQKLVMMPGERYEVVIDFANLAPGTKLTVKNVARTPYPAGATPTGGMGEVMQFVVTTCASGKCGAADPFYNPAVSPTIRAPGQKIQRLATPATGTVAPGVTVSKTRQLTLNEVMGMPMTATDPVTGTTLAYPGGPLEILVNNTKWSGDAPRPYGDFKRAQTGMMDTFLSELPKEGETEVWEIVNLTADAHPIHLHLVQFQLLNRQAFDLPKYNGAYSAAFPNVSAAMPGTTWTACTGAVYCPGFGPPLHYDTGNPRALGGNPDVVPFLKGVAKPPAGQETGWKDTVLVPPGQVTRIVVRWAPTSAPATAAASTLAYPFDPSGGFDFSPTATSLGGGYGYVWHCHIIDHEDNEMMRPDAVQPNVLASPLLSRPIQRGRDY